MRLDPVANSEVGSIGRNCGFDAMYDSDREFRDVGKVATSLYSAATNTGAFSIGGCDWSSKAGWKGSRIESARFGLLLNF